MTRKYRLERTAFIGCRNTLSTRVSMMLSRVHFAVAGR